MITGTLTKDRDVVCKCGGQVMVDGEGYTQLPVGFGFHSDQKFHVDSIRQFGYFGVCLDCDKKVFAPNGKRSVKTKVLKLKHAS